jgi:hypothetical protein
VHTIHARQTTGKVFFSLKEHRSANNFTGCRSSRNEANVGHISRGDRPAREKTYDESFDLDSAQHSLILLPSQKSPASLL